MWDKLIAVISAEWLLKKRDNGGALIALRSLIVSAIIFSLSIIILNLADPTRGYEFSGDQLGLDIKEYLSWFGVLFGSTYAALYSRFSSQWSYLANLYNSIKQTESSTKDLNKCAIAEWKAGFIEDAEYLHLAHKTNFVSIISAWCKDADVKKKYIQHTPGGEARFIKLQGEVDKRYEKIRKNLNKTINPQALPDKPTGKQVPPPNPAS